MEPAGSASTTQARPSPLPNFLIIGAMRSGTSSLSGYLRAHPQVFLGVKEPHFFDHKYDRGLDWYASRFSGANGELALGEGTQTYMYDERALVRMANDLPSAKLIAILRDPVNRAYSHYWLNRATGKETLEFPEALAAEPERLARGGDLDRNHYSYVDRGRYVHQLRRVCDHFPRENLFVTLFEELRDDPRGTYQRVCSFLGIDDSFSPPNLGVAVNRFSTYRSLGMRRWGLRLPYPFNRVVRRLNSRASSYPPMDPGIRRQLVEGFAGDNGELAAWLGRELAEWSS